MLALERLYRHSDSIHNAPLGPTVQAKSCAATSPEPAPSLRAPPPGKWGLPHTSGYTPKIRDPKPLAVGGHTRHPGCRSYHTWFHGIGLLIAPSFQFACIQRAAEDQKRSQADSRAERPQQATGRHTPIPSPSRVAPQRRWAEPRTGVGHKRAYD